MIEQNAFTIIFGIFVLLTCRDVFIGQSSQTDQPETVAKHIVDDRVGAVADHMDGSNMMSRPTVRIEYCHSCGYRQAFEELSRILTTAFPDLTVEGALHQPGWLKSQIVNLVFLTKAAVLLMIFIGYNPFPHLRMETPSFWTYLTQNRLTSVLMILFVANSIESNMMSTGAFEIYYNDMPVWSKLQTGKVPAPPELIQIVKLHHGLTTNRMIAPNLQMGL